MPRARGAAPPEPVEPAIQITTQSGLDYSVTTTTTVVEGTASDSDGTVTSVSLACVPSCGTPPNDGTPTAWSFTVPLAYGQQVLTVTATDDDTLTNVDTVTVTRYCPTTVTDELELWLHLNGNGTDSSGAGRTVTPSGGVTWGAGVVGSGAAVLDGTGSLSVASLLDTPPTVTLTAWVNPTAYPDTEADLVSLGDYVVLRLAETTMTGFYYVGGATWRQTLTTINLVPGWHQVAYSIMPGLQQLYLDAQPIGLATSHADAIVYTGLGSSTVLGKEGNGAGRRINGSLDEVRVYGCPQNATGIQTIEDYAEPATTNLSAPLHLRYVGP